MNHPLKPNRAVPESGEVGGCTAGRAPGYEFQNSKFEMARDGMALHNAARLKEIGSQTPKRENAFIASGSGWVYKARPCIKERKSSKMQSGHGHALQFVSRSVEK